MHHGSPVGDIPRINVPQPWSVHESRNPQHDGFPSTIETSITNVSNERQNHRELIQGHDISLNVLAAPAGHLLAPKMLAQPTTNGQDELISHTARNAAVGLQNEADVASKEDAEDDNELPTTTTEETPADRGRDRSHATVATRRGPTTVRRRREIQTHSASGVTKTSLVRRPGSHFEMQWRVGQAPNVGLRQSQEQSSYQHILHAASRYYSSNAESTWKLALASRSTSTFDENFDVLSFLAYVMTAAALITAGQPAKARETLDMMLPLARNLLLSQHPMTFWSLVEHVMDSSPTVLGNLRTSVTRILARMASDLLGDFHPLSVLLKTPLTIEQRAYLRSEAQRSIHSEMVRLFGPDSYQTFMQFGYWARTIASSGNSEEAITMLSQLGEYLERQNGMNSAMSVLSLIEQSRQKLVAGSASIKLECMLGDALRRNEILSSQQENPNDQSRVSGESALRVHGLWLMRIALLRLLGRVHLRRKNFAAAIYTFEQAVMVARPLLRPESSSMKMYESDLELTRAMEMEETMGVLTIQDPSDRLAGPLTITQFVPAEHRL